MKSNRRIYKMVSKFKKKYPWTIAIRLKKHSEVIEKFLDKDEDVFYTFCGQRNDANNLLFDSCVVALTNKRIIIGQKRALFGYYALNISTKLFNDLTISTGMFFGRIEIDTVKERIYISNIQKSALDEIETMVHKVVLENKKREEKMEKKITD